RFQLSRLQLMWHALRSRSFGSRRQPSRNPRHALRLSGRSRNPCMNSVLLCSLGIACVVILLCDFDKLDVLAVLLNFLLGITLRSTNLLETIFPFCDGLYDTSYMNDSG